MKYSVLLVLLGLFSFTGTAFAATTCQPIFGGGQSCVQNQGIALQSFVQNPKNQEYVPTLTSQDPAYQPDQQIMFKVSVHNTSGKQLTHVILADTLPSEVAFVSGNGTFDSNSNTLTTQIGTLDKDATNTVFIEGKVQPANKLASQSLICPVNQTLVAADNNILSQNNSQFCIQTKSSAVLGTNDQFLQNPPTFAPPTDTPIPATPGITQIPTPTQAVPTPTPVPGKTTPATGPETMALGLIPLLGGAGILLRRKASSLIK